MSKKRRQHSAEFKAQVGLETLRDVEPIHTIAAKHQLHPEQVRQWKKEVSERLPEVFSQKADGDVKERETQLFEEIGRLKMELEWLKKKLVSSNVAQRRHMIEPKHPKLTVTRQCELLGLPRASFYYELAPESDENLQLMRVIDETYLPYPFFGSRQMTRWLWAQGHKVNRKRVRRLMRAMDLQAIYRKPNLSRANTAHPVYPYLLRDVVVDRANQVWATDITYLPVVGGCAYLCAVIDWHSRRVLAWELSNTLDARFWVRTVARAMTEHGVPEIFNTDQDCQFTSAEFTQPLLKAGVNLSMDGKP